MTESELMVDIAATFPHMWMRPMREYGATSPGYDGIGVQIGEGVLADGEEIVSTLACNDPDVYDGHVHLAFIEWVKSRGWRVEEYDPGVVFVMPLEAEGAVS